MIETCIQVFEDFLNWGDELVSLRESLSSQLFFNPREKVIVTRRFVWQVWGVFEDFSMETFKQIGENLRGVRPSIIVQ